MSAARVHVAQCRRRRWPHGVRASARQRRSRRQRHGSRACTMHLSLCLIFCESCPPHLPMCLCTYQRVLPSQIVFFSFLSTGRAQSRFTALIRAALGGHTYCVCVLLENGAAMDFQERHVRVVSTFSFIDIFAMFGLFLIRGFHNPTRCESTCCRLSTLLSKFHNRFTIRLHCSFSSHTRLRRP